MSMDFQNEVIADMNLSSPCRRRMRPCQWRGAPWIAAAAAAAAAVVLCGTNTMALTFGVRSHVTTTTPLMVATVPFTFRKKLPSTYSKTPLHMVLSMSTESSTPSSSFNNTTDAARSTASSDDDDEQHQPPEPLAAHVSWKEADDDSSTNRIDDERFQLDQYLFEKQASEQRSRLQKILLATQLILPAGHNNDTTSFQLQEFKAAPSTTTIIGASQDDDEDGSNGKSIFGIPLTDIWKARFLLLLAAALYGTNFSLVKILGDTMPVAISGTLRFGMASLITLPWLLMKSPQLPPVTTTTAAIDGNNMDGSVAAAAASAGAAALEQKPKKKNWWDDLVLMITAQNMPGQQAAFAAALAGFEVGMWNSVGYVAQAVGLETTLASKSAFLCSLAVVTVPILDFFIGKRLLPKQIIGALLAVAGVGFLELGSSPMEALASLNYGDLASLVQPLAFGMGFWRMENAMSQYPQHAARSTAAQMLAVFFAYAAYCAVACGVTHTVTLDFSQLQAWLTDPSTLFALFWTGVITTALTVYMETLALKTLSAAETTLIFSTEPLWGTAFAAYIMGEQLGMDAAVGAVLILSGCLFSNLGLDGLKGITQRKPKQVKLPDPSLDKPAPVLVRSGVAGALGSWISNLGEVKYVAEVAAAAAAEELERLDDVIQSVNDIL